MPILQADPAGRCRTDSPDTPARFPARKATGSRPQSLSLSLIAGAFCVGVPSLVLMSSCATSSETFPVVVGAMAQSDVRPCSDYASYFSYAGTPYYVRVPETGKTVRRHQGIDFCAVAGSDVIAAASGTVVQLVPDNPHRGGRVTLRTGIEYQDNGKTETLHLDALHITPQTHLKIGDAVKVGEVIGHIQPAGKPEVGPRSHVHFSAGPIPATWVLHTDPNRFWQKGPGIVSCLDPGNPPGDSRIVAPIRC